MFVLDINIYKNDKYTCQIDVISLQCYWKGKDAMKTRLKELRAREGLNQTQLAKKAKVSRQTISLIEREEFIPSLLIAVRIARIFQESIEDIFIFEEDELK